MSGKCVVLCVQIRLTFGPDAIGSSKVTVTFGHVWGICPRIPVLKKALTKPECLYGLANGDHHIRDNAPKIERQFLELFEEEISVAGSSNVCYQFSAANTVFVADRGLLPTATGCLHTASMHLFIGFSFSLLFSNR